jgi:hypothetical protein
VGGGQDASAQGRQGVGLLRHVLGARRMGAGGEVEDVAVKVFLGQSSSAAFKKELSNLQVLTTKISPAALVVRLVGVVESSEGQNLWWPALVMTPLCVESLEQRIDRFEPYMLQEALAWAVDVSLSLHRLHRESRLRHGDVTLRNVLLGRDGRAYLADMGVAEHNHPYGRQGFQEGTKGYSASVAPDMVEGGQGVSSDARADAWSWGVLLHALLTRSTAMANEGSVSAYVTTMEDGRWWETTAALWGPEELSRGVFEAVRRSLCERGERVGLLAGAVLLGQQGLVEAMVGGTDAPAEVKEAELRIARLEARVSHCSSPVEALLELSECHEAVGDEAQAIACLQQAERSCDQADDIRRAKVLHELGVALQRRGDHEEAIVLFEEALAMRRRLLPADHPDIARSLDNLASSRSSQGEYAQGALLHEEALAMRRRLLPEDHPDIAMSLNNLAICHYCVGEYDKGVLLYKEALAMRRRLHAGDHLHVAMSLSNLANNHIIQGEYDKAVRLHQEV